MSCGGEDKDSVGAAVLGDAGQGMWYSVGCRSEHEDAVGAAVKGLLAMVCGIV